MRGGGSFGAGRRATRRVWVALVLAVVLLAVGVAAGREPHDAPAPAAAAQPPGRHAERAQLAYAAMRRAFAVAGTGLYRGTRPVSPRNPYAMVWPFSQALAATVALSAVPGVGDAYRRDRDRTLAAVASYWNAGSSPPGYDARIRPPRGPGSYQYFDDNEWIALELVKVYRLTGRAAELQQARTLFELVVSGWDSDASHPCPGGVFWTKDPGNTDRNAISNAPGAQLGLQLAAITGDDRYAEWAKKMYDWVEACLRGDDGLYLDHVDLAGKRDDARWSYNQGMMIGASVLLFRRTGDRRYLREAEAIADGAVARFGADAEFREPAFFAAILFENLLQLAHVDGRRRYRQVAEAYADRAWAERQDGDGLFRFSSGPRRLLEQAGLVRLYAELAWGSDARLLGAPGRSAAPTAP